MAEVHGEDVIWHVGNAIPNDKIGGQPVSGTEDEQNRWTNHVDSVEWFQTNYKYAHSHLLKNLFFLLFLSILKVCISKVCGQ